MSERETTPKSIGDVAGSDAFHEWPRETTSGPAASRKIDGKFSTDGAKIFNTVSGEEILDDEPLFLLRARDNNAYDTLMHYLALCGDTCNDLHLEGIKQTIREFIAFNNDHPERMKQPGITKHLKLEGPAASADDVIEFTTRLTTDPVTGEKRMLTTAGPAASAEPTIEEMSGLVDHLCAIPDKDHTGPCRYSVSAEPRCQELIVCNETREHAIHDPAEGHHPFKESAEPRMVSVNEPRFNCPNCSASVAESAREQHSREGCVTSAKPRTEERLRIGTPDTALGVDKDDYKPHKARPQSAEPREQFEKFAVTRKLPLDKLPADRQQETGYCYRDKSTNACWEAWRAAEAYAASKLGRLRAERKVYAWQKRPDRCPECDSECFITSGGMNLTCYHCFLSEQTEKAEAERDGLREALRELQACCKKVKWFLGSQSHSWYPKDDAMLEDAIVKAEAELSAAAPTKKTDSPK